MTPFYQAVKSLIGQTIAPCELETFALERVTNTTSLLDPENLLVVLYGFIAIMVNDLLCLEPKLRHAVHQMNDSAQGAQAAITALRHTVKHRDVTAQAVLSRFCGIMTEHQLRFMGPLCWAIAGGEHIMKPVMAQCGVEHIDEVELVQATLDACLEALRQVKPTPIDIDVQMPVGGTMDNQSDTAIDLNDASAVMKHFQRWSALAPDQCILSEYDRWQRPHIVQVRLESELIPMIWDADGRLTPQSKAVLQAALLDNAQAARNKLPARRNSWEKVAELTFDQGGVWTASITRTKPTGALHNSQHIASARTEAIFSAYLEWLEAITGQSQQGTSDN